MEVGSLSRICLKVSADLELSMAFHEALTNRLANNDLRKFQLGTPAEVWRTMYRCWEMEPTPERIVQDILNLPRVLEKIVDANGCVVHGEALRNGHRARRLDGKGILKTPLRASNRKETLVDRPVHPDALFILMLRLHMIIFWVFRRI